VERGLSAADDYDDHLLSHSDTIDQDVDLEDKT
jgi:hypothetical protein